MKHIFAFFLAALLLFSIAQAETAAEPQDIRTAQVGDYVVFGCYPQTADGTDMTPIEWLVLARDEQSLILISHYVLDSKPYNDEPEPVTWETCSLRKWLNGEFYSKAFSDEEKQSIQIAHIANNNNAKYKTPGGSDTDDAVFLLSLEEAGLYFPLKYTQLTNVMGNSEKCVGIPTAYALANGVLKNEITPDIITKRELSEDLIGTISTKWWLRSSGYHTMDAAVVSVIGSVCYGVESKKENHITDTYGGVRPVIVLNIK